MRMYVRRRVCARACVRMRVHIGESVGIYLIQARRRRRRARGYAWPMAWGQVNLVDNKEVPGVVKTPARFSL